MKGKLLTARQVENAKATDQRQEIADGGTGLYLVIQPSGAKTWAVRYRFHGKPKKHTLGKFPLISLASAREAAGEAFKLLDYGTDPSRVKREAKNRRPDTVQNVGEAFILKYAKPRIRTWGEVERTLELHVYSRIGDRDITSVTRRDILDVLDAVAAGGATVRANRVLAYTRRMFGWALERDIITDSPVAGIKAPAPERHRDRVLSDDELRAFVRACDRLDMPAPEEKQDDAIHSSFGAMFKLLLLTLTRRDEVAAAPWAEFDLSAAQWTLPGERTKNGRPNQIPLSNIAAVTIESLPSKGKKALLFPSRKDNGRPASGFGRAKARLDRLMLEELRTITADRGDDPDKVQLLPWRLHDLRRTGATGMARLGVGIHIVERLLNHVAGSTTGGIVAVYQQHDFSAEKRAAVEAWAKFIDGLTSAQPSNVVALRHGVA